ncbi:MAG: gliding motility lipoprotein GldJ [Flavobacteriales bacterium]|nr:gliding motility lipoprotein GldJ [Flavobacteriales bacterium]|tara:strand:+ start:7 stop:1722 length:1716 start_codon:yes stop_codon:yes gene_type:complete
MKNQIIIIFSLIFIIGCSKEKSKSTGWNYNDPKHGGFEISTNYTEQVTPDGMAFIEGGSFTMGRVEQDVLYDWNNVPKTVTVSSFYMDETEVRNLDYLEYLFWIERVYGSNYDNGSYPEVYWKALPDTNVWRDKLSYNEPYVESYLRHPAFHQYPVVGVSWEQAVDYCAWRTDRVNERILIDNGYLWEDPEQVDENVFKTDAYKMGQYEGRIRRQLPNLKLGNHSFNKKAGKDKNSVRNVGDRDGILLPRFRLPTEAEWEFAALALVGNTLEENVSERKIYPWNGDGVRNPSKRNKGEIVANFKRSRGDNMGTAGRLNDNADKTAPVISYWPNEYGLYNMAGNVSEWVMDVYRPLIDPATNDMNPFRGNVFETWQRDEDRFIVEKDSLGNIIKREVTVEENLNRRNYSTSDNINYLDGDYDSRIQAPASDWQNVNGTDKRGFVNPIKEKEKAIAELLKNTDENGQLSSKDILEVRKLKSELEQLTSTNQVYELNETSLISDQSRVYKGGSYKDRAYWMVPGTRRFLDQKQSTSYIGFRCAMDRLGPPTSNLKENMRRPVDWNKNNGYYEKK